MELKLSKYTGKPHCKNCGEIMEVPKDFCSYDCKSKYKRYMYDVKKHKEYTHLEQKIYKTFDKTNNLQEIEMLERECFLMIGRLQYLSNRIAALRNEPYDPTDLVRPKEITQGDVIFILKNFAKFYKRYPDEMISMRLINLFIKENF